MKDCSATETIAELIAKPGNVASRITLGGSIRLHFDRHDPAPREFGKEIDLVSTLLGTEVVETRACLGDW